MEVSNSPRGAVRLSILLLAMLVVTASAQAGAIRLQQNIDAAGLRLESQDPTGVEIHYAMDRFAIDPLVADGRSMHSVRLPGSLLPNNPGAPNLPGMGRIVAIPAGASVSIDIVSVETQTYTGLDIAPARPIQKETDPLVLRYEKDPAIYGRNEYYPTSPVLVSAPWKMRGVDVVSVGITPFQYNPESKELIVYTNLDIRLDFEGGSGQFGEDRLRSRFWEPMLREHLFNYDALPPVDLNRAGRGFGWEYVILCPDEPSFITWADSLKTWRIKQGISTEVFTTTDIGGSSQGIVEAFLDHAYLVWEVPPTAFLILGDHPDGGLPGIPAPTWNDYCLSDNVYADVDGDDLPDMVSGRITASTFLQLERIIGKMLSYEREPYTDPGFYDQPLLAGGWQDDRWFILCSEIVHGFFSNVLGKSPTREYAIYSGDPDSVWSTNENTELVLDYFGPDSLGYVPATCEHLQDWDADSIGVSAAINAGTFLVLHRDHGEVEGWGEPVYRNSNIVGLTNDMFPFVLSINCCSGKFDNPTGPSFAEKFHRVPSGKGALGLIAATETSYSFVNDAFTWGIFDSMWPEFDPYYGGADSTGLTSLRTAFAHTSGKYYLESHDWPYNPQKKVHTYHLFHHHGDAFMRLYSEIPESLDVVHAEYLAFEDTTFSVQADSNAIIALTLDGEIVDVRNATGGVNSFTVPPQTTEGTLFVTVTAPNYFRYEAAVPIVPPIFYLAADGSGDVPTIQAAIDSCVYDGSSIRLANGIYIGEGNRDLDFGGKRLLLTSLSGDRDSCIIDCEGDVVNQRRGFHFHSDEDTTSIVQALTIQNGFVADSLDQIGGGAILCRGASPRIVDCVFRNNTAILGGALACSSATPQLSQCLFTENVADSLGGGVFLTESSPSMEFCVLDSNTAAWGGAIALEASSPEITNCTLAHNAAANAGAGLYCSDSSPTVERCLIAFSPSGEGVACSGISDPVFTCCDVFGNAGGDGLCGTDGGDNISAHPRFCDADSPELTLGSNSPCAVANSPCGELIGAGDVGCGDVELIVVVNPEGTGDYVDIQTAIDDVHEDYTIALTNGIFTGEGNRDLDFGGKRLLLTSLSGERDSCIIDCQGDSLNLCRGFHFQSGEDSTTVVQALTIQNGFVTDDLGQSSGGAILCRGASPRIVDCVFRNNTAILGGALACSSATPQLSQCLFTENAADSLGGGAFLIESSPSMEFCILDSNTAAWGGAIALEASSPEITNCTLAHNAAANAGAGLYCSDSSPTVERCLIAFSPSGEGVACSGISDPVFTCCDVFGNVGGNALCGTNGGDNIASHPRFCDADNPELTLGS
ncbi:C25 family cysteine peptidase, partial [Candidatus Eisenbacteria bacterium]